MHLAWNWCLHICSVRTSSPFDSGSYHIMQASQTISGLVISLVSLLVFQSVYFLSFLDFDGGGWFSFCFLIQRFQPNRLRITIQQQEQTKITQTLAHTIATMSPTWEALSSTG